MKPSPPLNTQRLNRRQWVVLLLAVSLLLAWIGVNALSRLRVAMHPPPPETVSPLAVEIFYPEPGSFEVWKSYAGSIAAEHQAVLQSRLTLPILDMPARSGERVQRGGLLARLDDEELRREQARLEAAAQSIEAELSLARKQLERRRRLFAASAASREQLDEALSRLASLEASREENRQAILAAQSRLEDTRITAPFDGVVGQLFALPGDLAAPGRGLLELVDTSRLKAVFSLPQQDLSRGAQSTRAQIHVPAKHRVLEGRVNRVHPSLQLPGRGALAEVFLHGEVEDLLPGMDVVVRLLTDQRSEVLAIPVEALHGGDGEAHVFVLHEGTALRRPVAEGPQFQGRVVIEEGLAVGDAVILTPHPGLADGRSVIAGAIP